MQRTTERPAETPSPDAGDALRAGKRQQILRFLIFKALAGHISGVNFDAEPLLATWGQLGAR